ncbi:hypothetical protein MM221_02195 [Salipaludibacillus sp. LMS25]|jgi:Rad3-related DNA helicase|uniref:hypothetical protein n=1 Tax=Salipaludibacillus sp. LMS25 TaxID=2924031 RepID=UPI0020D02E52|nr:hypothetical protein [Salipaludibacillus sp. LMS25]UTR15427.1 hypothetical protein MM221_02195 [Salipaludibacillus sp. LMS25]
MKNNFFAFIGCVVLILAACNDNEEGSTVEVDESEDLTTLVSTNKKLTEQLEDERKKIEELEEENKRLKNDILTYKQHAIETEEQHEDELALRVEIEEKLVDIFEYMHERNHDDLQTMLASNVSIDRDLEALHIVDDESGIDRTMHYLQFDPIPYIAQRSFSLEGDDHYTSEYAMYTLTNDGFQYDGGIEVIFTFEEGWKLSSIRYVK